MCGFVGVLRHERKQALGEVLTPMSNRLVHRGPDQSGFWIDEEKGIGLAHRRLSILDLSDAGKQPMVSESGRYVIAFNGEIYNHIDIRKELEKHASSPRWRGRSDTETLLAGFERWGVINTLSRCIGMFAIGLWDNQTHELSLIRDRIGEKPLYYGWQGREFLFGSELKALNVHPSFRGEIDRDALGLFVQLSYIPSPFSIYKGISKVPPGCIIRVSKRTPDPVVESFWSATAVIEEGILEPFVGTPEESVEQLYCLLRDSVEKQMLSDVPLGAFLSGGVDSSTVVALMQEVSSRKVKTFSIGSDRPEYDESEYAAAVADYLGTDHTSLRASPQDALEIIPSLPYVYDEPFADASQIPTILVSRLAREEVTVCLSGDGGDELFAGYNRYEMTASLWEKLSVLPVPIRTALAKILVSASPHVWDIIAARLERFVPGLGRWDRIGDKIHKGAAVLASKSVGDLYTGLISRIGNSADIVLGYDHVEIPFSKSVVAVSSVSDIELMMASDLLGFLPDDVLCKVDRAAMSVSLETRVPILDHRVVEYAWSLPVDLKIRKGVSKWPLRQVLYRYVPESLIERPKRGFSLPIDYWLRTSLREWAAELLQKRRIDGDGFFVSKQVDKLWEAHSTGRQNNGEKLWNILMFNSWLDASRIQMSGDCERDSSFLNGSVSRAENIARC